MSSIYDIDRDLVALGQHASRFFGEEATLFDLSHYQEAKIWQRGRREGTTGLGEAPAVTVHHGRQQDDGLFNSIWGYWVEHTDGPLRVAYLGVPPGRKMPSLWAVAKRDYPRLQQYVADVYAAAMQQVSPVMDAADQAKLLHNTIEFLQRDDALLKKYRVPKK